MAIFLVFRQMHGITRDQYAAAQQAVADAAGEVSSRSRAVRYLGGFFVPDGKRAICIFDAPSTTDIIAVNEQAGVPFSEVFRAIEMRPRITAYWGQAEHE